MMKKILVGTAIFTFCASCALGQDVFYMPLSPSASLCPPGQFAASQSPQLWANQNDVHAAWDCFVPRAQAFEPRSRSTPDPALHSPLPTMRASRQPTASARTTASAPSSSSAGAGASASPASAQSAPVHADPDVKVSIDGNPPATAGAPQPNPQTAPPSGSTAASLSTQETATRPTPEVQSGPQGQNLPGSLPTPLDNPDGGNTAANPVDQGQDSQALLDAQPVLPSQGNETNRSIQ